jgi:hypothetical protein
VSGAGAPAARGYSRRGGRIARATFDPFGERHDAAILSARDDEVRLASAGARDRSGARAGGVDDGVDGDWRRLGAARRHFLDRFAALFLYAGRPSGAPRRRGSAG